MLLLDTNVLIYLLGGNRAVANLIKDKLWYISFINEIEILSKPELTLIQTKATQALLNECIVIEMSASIKERTIDNCKKHKLKLADSIILSTAQEIEAPLITADHIFKRVAHQHPIIIIQP